jgi:prepilin-type N-terminal cleavage/methylation domain-containing protein
MSVSSSRGFTIVELLIVIVVIAVLAAITIVAYNGIQARSQSSVVLNDLANLSKKLSLFYVDNSRYPNSTTELESMKFSASASSYNTTGIVNLGYCNSGDYLNYAIFAKTKSGDRYYVTNRLSPRGDDTGTTWTDTTGNVSAQCGATTAPVVTSHGYWTGASPMWRVWTSGGA